MCEDGHLVSVRNQSPGQHIDDALDAAVMEWRDGELRIGG
jgi:hypothetical protein